MITAVQTEQASYVVRTLRDLEQFGILYLTGESCGYMYRGLYDLTVPGKRVVAAMLGIEYEKLQLNPPFNSRGIGSIMLPHEALKPLGVFGCLEAGCQKVYIFTSEVIGASGDRCNEYDEAIAADNATAIANPNMARWQRFNGGIERIIVNHGRSRNLHLMSGRTV